MLTRLWLNSISLFSIALLALACGGTNPDGTGGDGGGGGGGSGGTGTGGSGGSGGGTGGSGGGVVTGLTIYDLQDFSSGLHPSEESVVRLENVVVTAARGDGDADFFIQVQEANYDERGTQFAGIYCFRGQNAANTILHAGDLVEVQGSYVEYPPDQPGTVSQIVVDTVIVTGSGTVPAPRVISDPSEVATGGIAAELYEGVFIRVEDLDVINLNPDGPEADFGEFTLEGGLRVDDHLYDDADLDGRSADHFTFVQGVLHYSYSNGKLLPREAADLDFSLKPAQLRTIYQIQDRTHIDVAPELELVGIENVVVTAVGDDGFWVQVDPLGPDYDFTYGARFSGIYCELADPAVQEGDVVNVEGIYQEYYELSEIVVTTVTDVGAGTVPLPTIVDSADIANDGAEAEDYEGVLVRVDNVDLVDPNPDAPGDFGQFVVSGGLIIDNDIYWDASTRGRLMSTFYYIIGVHQFAYGDRTVLPRGEDDMDGELAPLTDTTIYQIQDRTHATAVPAGTGVRVQDVVVTAADDNGEGDFWVQIAEADYDGAYGSEFSGIHCARDSSTSGNTVVAVGDVVAIEGVYEEYFELSRISPISVVVTGAGTGVVPAPTVVTAGDIANGGVEAETYEGVLIRVENVDLTIINPDAPDDFGQFVVEGDLIIDNDLYWDASTRGRLMSSFNWINGVHHYAYGDFKVFPREAGDIDGTLAPLSDTTIYQIQDPAHPSAVMAGTGVRISDVVVTAAYGTGDADFWVQIAEADYDGSYGSEYSAVYCYREDAAGNTVVAVGDVVTVEGVYEEFFDLSRISPITVTVTGAGTGLVPAPTLITPADVATGGSLMENYESVLIEAEDVALENPNPAAPSDFGEFTIEGGLRVDDVIFRDSEVLGRIATTFNLIQGVLYYAYGDAKLLPRDANDIDAVIGSATVYTIYQIQDRGHATPAPTGGLVSIENVIVTASRGDGTGDFWVQIDPAGADWDASSGTTFSGIAVSRMPDAANVVVAVGDVVTVDGLYEEFFNLSRIIPIMPVTISASGATLPNPSVVNAADVATDGSLMEEYEGVLIEVQSTNLDQVNPDAPSDFGVFTVTGGLWVDDVLWFDAETIGRLATSFNYIRGVLDYSYSNSKLYPRDAADMDAVLGAATVYTVYEIQDRGVAAPAPVDGLVRIENVVVTGVRGDGTGDFFVQVDPTGADFSGAAFSGILVSRFPDVANLVVAEGDVVNVEGMYTEYFDNSQIGPILVEYVGAGTPIVSTTVAAADIETSGAMAEDYEGVLVTVTNVDLLEANPDSPSDFGEFTVTSGLRVHDMLWSQSTIVGRASTTFVSITGPLYYAYSNTKMEPRYAADIDSDAAPTAVVTIYELQDAGHANYPGIDTYIRLENVVVTGVRGIGDDHFFVQIDPTGADWDGTYQEMYSGIYIYRPGGGPTDILTEGDVINLEGTYTEYFDVSEIGLAVVEPVGTTTPLTPLPVTTADIAVGGPLAEVYEGVLVMTSGTMVNVNPADPGDFGEFEIENGILVDDLLFADSEVVGRAMTTFTSIVGPLNHDFGAYRVLPRSAADINGT